MMLNKNKILAIIVIITILAIQFSYVKAEETNSYTPIELDITVNNNQQKLKVINKDNAWYAEAYALGNLAHSSKSAKTVSKDNSSSVCKTSTISFKNSLLFIYFSPLK